MVDMNGLDADPAPGHFRSLLPGTGFCSPWTASKTVGFSHHQLLPSNWGGVGTEDILKPPSLSIPRHSAWNGRGWAVVQLTDTAQRIPSGSQPQSGCAQHTERAPASWGTTAQGHDLPQAVIYPSQLPAPKDSSGLAHALAQQVFSSEKKSLRGFKINMTQHWRYSIVFHGDKKKIA